MRSLPSGGVNRSPQREGSRADEGGDFVEGMSVEARFRGGSKYYAGRISRVRLNGTFDIDYADGEKEIGVKRENIRSKARDQGSFSPRGVDRDRSPVSRRIEEGAKVEANYRGKGNWYPGKITRDRGDGTFDVAYDDGEAETRVDELLIRVSGGSSSSTRNDVMDTAGDDFRMGSKIEADYRGKGKYYPGKITRVRLNGTFDIDYDDGEKEIGISRSLIRSVDSAHRSSISGVRFGGRDEESRIAAGDRIEARSGGGTRWLPGTVERVTSRNTFDIQFDDGDYGSNIPRDDVRPLDSEKAAASAKRAAYIEEKIIKENRDSDVKRSNYRKGDRVACYWYRSSSLGAAKSNQRPKSGIVICYNSDGTYTIELELDGNVIDDVPESQLKDWSEGNADLTPSSGRVGQKEGIFDKWAAVFEMGREFVKQGRIRHQIPSTDLISDEDLTSTEKIQKILGSNCVRDFEDSFEKYDRYNDGEIDFDSVLLGFSKLGGQTDESELRRWTKKNNKDGKQQKIFDFTDFVLSYANIFHPCTHTNSSLRANESLGTSLRISGEWKSLGGFARSFGKKQLQDLERAFDAYAEKDVEGNGGLRAGNILEAFHRLGRAVTVTRLQEYLTDADMMPQDVLSLADFVAVFAFFFSPTSSDSKISGRATPPPAGNVLTISEVAVQTLQEERWRGSPDQTNDFIRRLCSSRSDATVDCITSLRDAFEVLDTDGRGEVSSTGLKALLISAKISSPSVDHLLVTFKSKLDRQARGTFSLPELFEQIGPALKELCDSSVSVAEAFAMLRMQLSATDVRAAADAVRKVLDTLLEHVSDPKYWQVNVRNEVSCSYLIEINLFIAPYFFIQLTQSITSCATQISTYNIF